MFNPDKDDYPQNEAGEPEFASITLHIDPVLAQSEGDQVVQKMVLATDTPIEALAKIAPHFGEPGLLASPKNAALMVEAGRQANPVFIYFTPRNGHVLLITSTPTWDMLVQSPDFGRSSCLLASEKLQEIAAKVADNLVQFAGGFSSLMMIDLSLDKEVAGQPGASSDEDATERRGSNSAESLRDTANIENV